MIPTAFIDLLIPAGALLVAFAAGGVLGLARRRAAPAVDKHDLTRRILLPFAGGEVSKRALQAAIRLAKAEDAVIMPAYLACVPLTLPLDAPLPVRCNDAMPMLEAIEQRAGEAGVAVDARVIRGRTFRDALRRLLATETVDRVIVPVPSDERVGLTADDIEWMLHRVDAEVMVLRPAPGDRRTVSAAGVRGHF